MPFQPIIVQIGPFALRWYAVMIMLGVVAATLIALREARRRGQNPDHIWGLFPWVLAPGIIGARLGWVLVSLPTIEARGWQHALFTWEGGLSIQGALVGGIAGGLVYARRQHLNFLGWADIIVPGVALAQAIGRWGNFFNQELFGAPCDQPWCIPINDDVLARDPRFTMYVGQNVRFAPTFAYEMVWDLLNFALLMWLARRRSLQLRAGDLLWIYGIFYSIGRFFLEDVRLDSAMVGSAKAPQIIALLTIVLCIGALVWRRRPGSQAPPSLQAAAAEPAPVEAEPAAPGAGDAGAAPEPSADEAPLPVGPTAGG
jgi:phosphatidylglycerol---prolipoprotein diacylglyceryl transferase